MRIAPESGQIPPKARQTLLNIYEIGLCSAAMALDEGGIRGYTAAKAGLP